MNKDVYLSCLTPYFLGLLLVIFLAIFYFLYTSKQQRIHRWQKSLNLHEHAGVFHELYQNANGFLLSQRARQRQDAMEYAYGEIEFLSFTALLSLAKPNANTVFYDLGSGIGKAVLACVMVFPIRKSIGIELFPELHFDACKRVEQLATSKNYTKQAQKIQFILGDFLDANLDDATLIFINSTAFFGPTWEKICAKIDKLSHLTTVITISKTLTSADFKLTVQTQVEMSWGIVFAYIHTRKTSID